MLCCRGWRNRRIENRHPARCRNQRASSGAPRDGQDTGVGAQRTSLRKRKFHDVDLANCFLVVAATSSSKLHKRIFRLAKRRGVLCDVVDVRNSATSTTLPIYLMFIEGAPFGRVLDRTQNLPQRGALRNGMQIVPSCSRASGVFC